MRCLITGATGHLGSFLTRFLLNQGHEIAIIVRPQSNFWRISDVMGHVRKIPGNLANIEAVENDILAFAADTVIHLGWCGVVSANRNDPRQIMDNLNGSLALLKIAQRGGAQAFIGIGSQAEYGEISETLTESTRVIPNTAYGVTKLSVGLLTRELCGFYGMRYLWFRLLATYGPKDDVRRLIPSVIHNLLGGKKPSLTAGDQQWDYLYVDDFVSAIDAALKCPQAEGMYVLGSGTATSVRKIVESIRNEIDPRLPLGLGEVAYAPQQIMRLVADPLRFRSDTGWSPQIDLPTGIKLTVDSYRTLTNA